MGSVHEDLLASSDAVQECCMHRMHESSNEVTLVAVLSYDLDSEDCVRSVGLCFMHEKMARITLSGTGD